MPRYAVTRKSPILLGRNPSSAFNRIVAKAIDLLVVTAVYFILRAVWHPAGAVGAALLVGALDALGDGQSIGKRIIGLRVIEDATNLSCSISHSIMRNLPFVLSIASIELPVVWALVHFVTIPFLILELYLVMTLETGVRTGDVMSNTLVVEYSEDRLGTLSAEDNS